MQPAVPPRPVRGIKNEWLAVILSLLLAGLGQIFVGYIKRGLVILSGSIVIVLLLPDYLLPLALIYLVWNVYDAYKLAKKHNQKLMSLRNPP